jgi:exosortase/archaeosortase family protein
VRIPQIRRDSLATVATIFILVFLVFEAAIWAAALSGRLDWLMYANARAATALIRGVGIPATLSGNQIFLATRTLRIDLDCTALPIAALYSALVIAYPLPIRSRLLALGIGLPVIAIANLLRLLGVAVASEYMSPQVFVFAHEYLFKIAMVFVVVALWAVWLQMARGNAKTV